MRGRIALSMMGLVAVTMVGLSLVLVQVFRHQYVRAVQAGLSGQATLIAASVTRMETGLAPPMPLASMAVALQPDPTTRVTFIAADGTVLADTQTPPQPFGNLAQRPEVDAALRHGRGEAMRVSTATGDDMLYVAIPVTTTRALKVVRVGVPLTTIAQAERQAATTVIIAALLAGLVAIGLAMLSAQQITIPLLTLRTAATQLAAGEVDVAMPIPRDATLAAVARDFNAMAAQVRTLIASREAERQRLSTVLMTMADGMMLVNGQNQIVLLNPAAERLLALENPDLPLPLAALAVGDRAQQIVHYTRGLDDLALAHVVDVTITAPQRVLRISSRCLPAPDQGHVLLVMHDLTDLHQAEQIRRTVLTNISHDLRTPLTALQAMIETLQDGAFADPAAADEFLGRMDAEVQHMHGLVGDMLDLARLESGGLVFDYQPVAVHPFVAQVLRRIQPQATKQQISLRLAIAFDLPPVVMDARRMEHALLNILANALRFTPAGGEIALTVAGTTTAIRLEVQDTGTGIAPSDLPHIFERFYKADQARRHGGAGVGLAIVQAIIHQHGGQVSATSRQPGGTTLTICLPQRPGAPPHGADDALPHAVPSASATQE